MANLPNVRTESAVRVRVTLTDSGVNVVWSSLEDVQALIYSESQKMVAGMAAARVDEDDQRVLVVDYPGHAPQYSGIAKLVIRAKYQGREKTYDVPVVNFVDTTAEATGVVVLSDPDIAVRLEVSEVSTSMLDDAIAAAFDAARQALAAADLADASAAEAQRAADEATEAARVAGQKAGEAETKARLANEKAIFADEKARQADQATQNTIAAKTEAEKATNAAKLATQTANNAATHQPRIMGGYWHIWDVEAGAYVSTGEEAQGAPGIPGTPGPQGPQGPVGPAGKDADETKLTELERKVDEIEKQVGAKPSDFSNDFSADFGMASEGGKTVPMVSITYAALKALRDGGKLVPGMQYRVTDYECTTVQENTKSAGHQFDIIVTADDEKTLNENARAIQHKGDTYFKCCNLAAWELKYNLDHNAYLFEWSARPAYFFVGDDWRYVRYPKADTNSKYAWVYDDSGSLDPSDLIFTTTNTPTNGDHVEQEGNEYEIYGYTAMSLPDNAKGVVWYMKDEYENVCYYDFKNIQYNKGASFVYTFGRAVDNSLNGNCNNNVLPRLAILCNITFGNDCRFNTFGQNCFNNTFGNDCEFNTFLQNCFDNTFGDNCWFNTFGQNCNNNIFGNRCSYKHLDYTASKKSGISGTISEYWFDGEKKW